MTISFKNYTQIRDFLYFSDEIDSVLSICTNTGEQITSSQGEYILGHKNIHTLDSISDGEFIHIHHENGNFVARNDLYGIGTIYFFEDKGKKYVSSSLKLILDKVENSIHLDKRKLSEYFAFGYQILDDDCHFSGVKVFKEPVK